MRLGLVLPTGNEATGVGIKNILYLLSGTQCSMASSCLVDGSLQHSVRHWSVPETYMIRMRCTP